jgi:hypothetical protein
LVFYIKNDLTITETRYEKHFYDTRRDASSTTTKIGRKYTEILHFPMYFPHFRFIQNEEGWDEKQFSDFCTVRILVQLGTGNTTKKKKK